MGLTTSSTLLSFTLLILCLVNMGNAIKCYQCIERPQSHEQHLSCSYFDKSRKFHMDCEHSTFCLKRASYLELTNGTMISISVHKCADQSQKTVIEDEHGAFNWGKIIHKYIYNDGCYSHPTQFMLTTTDITHCFCSTDFCNASVPSATIVPTTLLFGTVAILLMWI